MRKIFLFALLASAALPALAQNNELSFQFGKVFTEGRRFSFTSLPGEIFTEDGGFAGGITYNRRLTGFGFGSLHFHLPVFAYENKFDFDLIGTDTSRVTGFVTPGLQVRFFDGFFLQPYAFAGVGYAHRALVVPESDDSVRFDDEGTWGVSAGGGLDVLFGEHFGIRGEIRSLSTGSFDQVIPEGLTLNDPTTRWGATGGVVFRW